MYEKFAVEDQQGFTELQNSWLSNKPIPKLQHSAAMVIK
jgi:hypothetical protein